MKKAIWVCLVVAVVTGCGGTEVAEDNRAIGLAAECRAPCDAPELDSRAFLLESSQGFTPLAGGTPTLRFSDGSLVFGASCNSLHGVFALSGSKLVVTDAATTEEGCEPAGQAQDEWLASFITSSPRITLEENTLTLSGDSATLVFVDREVADPDRPLVATSWTIDSFITSDAVSNFAGPLEATILFAADGSLSFGTGCNSGAGTYTLKDGQLKLSKVGSNNRACMGPPAAAEEHILKVLNGEGTLTFKIEAARLTLQRGTFGISATARKP